MNQFASSKVLRKLMIIIAILAPFSAKADTNALALINMTGPITGYNGATINIGQLDDGVPATNQAFLVGKIPLTTNLFNSSAGNASFHATFVAGLIVSTNSAYQGSAPGATLYSISVSNNNVGPYGGNEDLNLVHAAFYAATNYGVKVINQSFGATAPSPANSLWERGIDRLVSSRDVIFIQAAGNAGSTTAPNSIEEPGAIYNGIVVGAVSNAAPGMATNIWISNTGGSSRGPTTDGRAKPDIVAVGAAIFSTDLPTGPLGTNVTTGNGTSFATPLVTGTAARLVQVAQSNSGVFTDAVVASMAEDPRVVKAVLLNSATKLDGWTQSGTVTNGGAITVSHPLDYAQGVGLLNAGRAYTQLTAGRFAPTLVPGLATIATNATVSLRGWDQSFVAKSIEDGGDFLSATNEYRLSQMAAGEARITLTWYRDVGAGTNFDVQGMANLDLRLWWSPDNAFTNLTLVAESVSTLDNVEHLYSTNLVAGYYDFSVNFKNYDAVSGPAAYSADYALAWDFTAVPEPSTFLLAAIGLAALCWRRRPRR